MLHETRMQEIQLVEYDDAWPSQFLRVAEQVRCAVPCPKATVYAALKRHLAVLHGGVKVAYTEAKAPFVRQVPSACPAGSASAHHGAA